MSTKVPEVPNSLFCIFFAGGILDTLRIKGGAPCYVGLGAAEVVFVAPATH